MKVPQLPLVLDNEVSKIAKTKEAVALLKKFGLYEDVERVISRRKLRPGKGKVRNKRYKHRKGPLFVVDDDCQSLVRALKNIPGVDTVNVARLNIRLLAPGGQLGRLVVYTENSLKTLESHFGSYKGSPALKKGYMLKREVMKNPDINAIINSDEIQRVLKKKGKSVVLHPR